MTSTLDTPTYTLHQGTAPLLISIPHLGTSIPQALRDRFSEEALQTPDTDWHLDSLYGFAKSLGASLLFAKVSRYVIDLNRPATGESLYPGQTTTGLCPIETFRGVPLYRPGCAPDPSEIERRVAAYWDPYHGALREELGRLRRAHSQVLLWEAHSIASVLPRLFEGKLPDLNFGTNSGASCASTLLQAVLAPLAGHPQFTHVVNGRFKGGYITRAFGSPADGVHAIQLEMSQSLYMSELPPFAYREAQAAQAQPVLRDLLRAGIEYLRVGA